MAKYIADNGKVVDTDSMECVVTGSYRGQYGRVSRDYYRTQKSHNWYRVEESSWSGECSISSATHISFEAAATVVALYFTRDDIIRNFPELSKGLDVIVDL